MVAMCPCGLVSAFAWSGVADICRAHLELAMTIQQVLQVHVMSRIVYR